MNVYWLEQIEADVPTENDWLSTKETAYLNGLRIPKRRADWRLGRWTAKCAVASHRDLPAYPQVLAKIEVPPGLSGAPEVFFQGDPATVTISLSHSAGRAACAVAASDVELGCDLEITESHSDAFISDYFTNDEQALIARAATSDRARLVTLLWSAKESALKALHAGLRLDTRRVAVSVEASFDLKGWSPLQVRHVYGRLFHGWWQHNEGFVHTLVANPMPESPIPLHAQAYSPSTGARCA
jgi:4'-phosphopantetheinyl transferase